MYEAVNGGNQTNRPGPNVSGELSLSSLEHKGRKYNISVASNVQITVDKITVMPTVQL